MLKRKKAGNARAAEEETKVAAGGVVAPRRTAGQIRLTKDMQELDKPAFIEMRVD